jgi:competence protein ComGC
MEVKKGQAIIIIFMIILLMIVSLLLPLILLQSVTKSFQIESGSSSSVVLAEKELQIEEVNNGDPLIKVYQNSQGIDYIKFEYIHGITPLDIEYIFYYDYDKAEWLLAYPGSYIVSGNTTLYLYTPPYYNGIIEIITSLGNAFYLPVQSS